MRCLVAQHVSRDVDFRHRETRLDERYGGDAGRACDSGHSLGTWKLSVSKMF